MTDFIKKKTSNKKFYGYTGPVKPEKKNKFIQKPRAATDKDNSSYGYSGKPRDVKNRSSWLTKKVKKNKKGD